MAGFNKPIWKRKDSVWLRERQIEKADGQHKRDLFVEDDEESVGGACPR
jgi:hypothetical protein